MKLINKVKRYYSILEEEIWERENKNIIFKYLSWLSGIPYIISFKIKRLQCWLFGCISKGGYGGFNLPDDAYSYWCNRCSAGYSNYDGNSDYEMLEGIDFIKNLFNRRKYWRRR